MQTVSFTFALGIFLLHHSYLSAAAVKPLSSDLEFYSTVISQPKTVLVLFQHGRDNYLDGRWNQLAEIYSATRPQTQLAAVDLSKYVPSGVPKFSTPTIVKYSPGTRDLNSGKQFPAALLRGGLLSLQI